MTEPDAVRLTAHRYTDALAFLDAHVNLELDPAPRAAAMRLDRIRRVTELMGDPQRACPVVHLTGTNGKGSTARMTTALLAAHGLSVGTYTSPHLERINERLSWNGEPIGDDDFADVVGAVAALEPLLEGERLTHFEILTAAAFRWFADIAVDVAVVEVGLGGRYDATNIADGSVAVVTNVDLDHAEVIGPTRHDIATEKAGIVKPGATLVLGEADPSLRAVFDADRVWVRGEEFDCVGNRIAVGGRVLDLRTPGGVGRGRGVLRRAPARGRGGRGVCGPHHARPDGGRRPPSAADPRRCAQPGGGSGVGGRAR
jgi:dihydrofolate synthase/folylpolyglutamate synthase